MWFYFVTYCMYVYVRYVRSLASVSGRFRGYVNQTQSSGIRTVSAIVPLFQF